MQSILQYRRIGLAARAQVQRDLEKANLLTIRPQPDRSRVSLAQSEQQSEKGKEKEEEEKDGAFTPGD